jgi:hypothetical protein
VALVGDPADKQLDARADGQFQPTVHRSGYGDTSTKLERAIDYFTRHPHATAVGGEGGMLAAEILRLRALIP